MKLNYDRILDRANEIYRSNMADKYKDVYPDLDMCQVELMLDDSVAAVITALVEVINEQIK